jgi:hypothetical protein
VEKGQNTAEEEVEEEIDTDPAAMQGPSDPGTLKQHTTLNWVC